MMCVLVHYNNVAQKGFCNKKKLLKLVLIRDFFYPGILFFIFLRGFCCVFFVFFLQYDDDERQVLVVYMST